MKKYIVGEEFGFYVEVPEYTECHADFTVYEIMGYEDDNNFEKELYLKAYIKWDSCSHFWFGDNDKDNPGYIHICGVNSYVKHISLMRWLYKKAFELMDRDPYGEGENWPKEHELNSILEERELAV
jgi:hypothetical protein